MSAPIMGLYWVGLASAMVAVVVYFIQIAMRPQWVRLISGAGLFLTAVGLAQAALSLRSLGAQSPQAVGGAIGVAALIAAVYFQVAAALRGRREPRQEPGAA